jgi:5-methylthioribose kinase
MTSRLIDHLIGRGLLRDAGEATIAPLEGGVSNDVFAVTAPGIDVVVKHALPRLRVEREWLADTGRIDIEARALRLAHALTPDAVPGVVDFSGGYLAIERAPRTWTNWRDDLMAGVVDPGVAAMLGTVLGTWQSRTAGDDGLAADFGDRTVFEQLRVDPFHREVTRRHPDLGPVVEATITTMLGARDCLVHGDFSPKNVLTSGDRSWVLDWEVAHLGDATFDPAFLLCHLLLKTVHNPASGSGYSELAGTFLSALTEAAQDTIAHDAGQLVRQTGCLLLARVDGKSPASYLTDAARPRVRALARRLLTEPVPDAHLDAVREVWEKLK